jgi:putative acetyltransferase
VHFAGLGGVDGHRDRPVIAIAPESPLGSDLALLMQRHATAMHADTPPESIHMLDAKGLAVPEVAFFVMRDAGQPVGMGAFKRLTAGHGEIKSMHVLHEVRGRGLARRMLDHLEVAALAAGIRRLSLETGAQASFAPARKLYEAAGYAYCAPFEGYWDDPMSVFMSKALA